MPVAASSVAPPASEAASVATTSATALAWGCVRTAFWGDVKGEVEHAANSAMVMVPAASRQTFRDVRRMRRFLRPFECGALFQRRGLDGRAVASVKGVQGSALDRIKTAERGVGHGTGGGAARVTERTLRPPTRLGAQ